MKNKRIITSIIFIIFVVMSSVTVFAHPGRTDANGGHYDRKTGAYHYHNGGSSGSSSSSSSGSNSSSSSSSYSSTPKTVYASEVTVPNIPSSIDVGESVQLKGSVYPLDAVDQDILWESSDTSIATIDSNGNLKTVKDGTVIISAKTSGGTKSQYTITVNEVKAEGIEIKNKTEQIFVGESVFLDVGFVPENTTNKNIEWKSADESIAKISSSGELFGVAQGKTIITAIHNEISDEFEIVVDPIQAETIVIGIEGQDDNSAISTVSKDETLQLRVEFLPENTTDKTIKWTVDNDEIAKIDESGLLTGLKSGTVLVKATAENGVYDEIEIKVSSDIGHVILGFVIIAVGMACIYILKRRKKNSKS